MADDRTSRKLDAADAELARRQRMRMVAAARERGDEWTLMYVSERDGVPHEVRHYVISGGYVDDLAPDHAGDN